MQAHRFPATSWSLIARACSPDGRAALTALCNAYWFPVYAFIRQRGGSADDACDRTQGFFAQLLANDALAKVDPKFGKKFRSWLLKCVKNHLANEHDHAHAKKRDPGAPIESICDDTAEGRFQLEASHDLTPERLYERAFAEELLARVLELLRAKYVATGDEARFEALRGTLSQAAAQLPYEEVAVELNLTEESVRKAAFDLRAKYKKLLRAEVACLVKHPDNKAEVDEEIRQLLASLLD